MLKMNGYNTQEELDQLINSTDNDLIIDSYLDVQDLVYSMINATDFYDQELLKWGRYFVQLNYDAIWNARRNKFMIDVYLKQWLEKNYAESH